MFYRRSAIHEENDSLEHRLIRLKSESVICNGQLAGNQILRMVRNRGRPQQQTLGFQEKKNDKLNKHSSRRHRRRHLQGRRLKQNPQLRLFAFNPAGPISLESANLKVTSLEVCSGKAAALVSLSPTAIRFLSGFPLRRSAILRRNCFLHILSLHPTPPPQ